MAPALALVAVMTALVACGEKKSSAPAGTAAAGSAAAGSAAPGSAAHDPWSGSAAAPTDAPCDEADIRRQIDDSLAASTRYLAALEKRTATWGTSCEAARKDLVALEPEATAFMTEMLEFVEWAKKLSPACRARVEQIGDATPATAELEKRTPAIEAKVEPLLERCKEHPGFQEAAAKGLRVMKKRK